MEGIDRNRISSLEPPAGKGRLHDLEAVRDEGDALEEFALVLPGSGARARPNAISGSMRGSARWATLNPAGKSARS